MRRADAAVMAERVRRAVQEGASDETVAKMLEDDFIPGGRCVSPRDFINVRGCTDPAARCATRTGHDIQSGPYYCGRPATKTADVDGHPGAVVHFCDDHHNKMKYDISMGERARAKRADESRTCAEL